ncbi:MULTISPECIES: LytTR family DNA-binding domain-containing protein [unclassified Imperialibacter]|uniref:LytR/AlgR family response regulator transcription factor n=1 Tax=unclassified Imperialibacter TaxID=2629706 RepID=UPI00125333AE|nr:MULTISPECIES: LytTR family DNA-binding domain-containing protein [unclassified Imperialibacter]CAD5262795.1 Two component transcriptional regulator, LytTR family [Imperialibacter sp. 75]CAD5275784.1 Two component transcriptional regulator, LytTR family [Imperialibacter sp. 89]VVT08451.1 Two component transcriptional regulator, LytTR family [Imperialibacter sp. EC-SDR9]
MTPLKCVVIDDEPLARECITGYVNQVDFMDLAGEGNNPLELDKMMSAHKIDLVFLDIQTPVINGIDFLKMAKNPPMVVITTAYPSYALDGYQLDVLDYLLKPITFGRFFKAATKAKEHQLLRGKPAVPEGGIAVQSPDHFFIKCDSKFERIYFDDILYVQALQNYVTIFTTKGKFITLLYLKNVEENLDRQSFLRVHKSFIVSIPKIQSIENNEIIIDNFRIPISRNYREQVLERVVNDKLWKK